MSSDVTSNVDGHAVSIPVLPIQVRMARIAIAGLVVLVPLLFLVGDDTAQETAFGDSTKYVSRSVVTLFFFSAMAVLTGIAAFVYLLQPGVFRVFGVMLSGTAAWLVYATIDISLGEHSVTLSPTKVTCRSGTRSAPVTHEIDFTDTEHIYIATIPGRRGPSYELVARAASDGRETRIPLDHWMSAALPRIMENATRQNVVVGDSEDGSVIPSALRPQASN